MALIDLAEGQRLADVHELWAARGRAIQGYAGLERALCSLLAMCGGMPDDVAALIFFKLNTHSRNQILKKLLRKAHGDTYAPFWNSAFKHIKNLTGTRNQIVHWSALATYDAGTDGQTTAEVILKPAELRAEDTLAQEGFERLTAGDMKTFEDECDYWALAIHRYCRAVDDQDDDPYFNRAGWLEVFKQPLTYPPSPQHPRIDLVASLQSSK